MKEHVDLHGYEPCPFAWRTRLTAREKGISFDWIPCDVENPDPRADKQNAGNHSPLMIHDWLTLTESMVICQYIDEAFPGRPLQPKDPAKRALQRLAMHELDFDFADDEPGPSVGEQATRAFTALESRLREAPWLGGETPSLLDLKIIPLLASAMLRQDASMKREHERCQSYWKRAQALDSYEQTRPAWAK